MTRCRLCERPAVSVSPESPICAWCIKRYLAPMAARCGASVEEVVALAVIADDVVVDRAVRQVEEDSVGLNRGGWNERHAKSCGADEEPQERPPTLAEVSIDKKPTSYAAATTKRRLVSAGWVKDDRHFPP